VTRDFLLAPGLALFSRPFYQQAARASLARGVLYLLYLSLLCSLGVGILFVLKVMPAVDEFLEWSASRLPVVTLTPDGPVTSVKEPFALDHPRYGTVLRIDTSRETPDPQQPAVLWLTKRQLVFTNLDRKKGREYRAYDIVPTSEEERAKWQTRTIDGNLLRTLYREYRSYAFWLPPLVIPLFFVWKLTAALAYSVLAVIINLVVRARLSYANLLTLTFFAMTPVILFEWLAGLGLSNPVASGVWLSWLVTGAYLFAAIFWSKHTPPDAATPLGGGATDPT
jgi:hypothetical protein